MIPLSDHQVEVRRAELEAIEAMRAWRRARVTKSGIATYRVIKRMDDALDHLDALLDIDAIKVQHGRA